MGTIISHIALFAFVPVVVVYSAVLLSVRQRGTRKARERLATTLALPVFLTLNTLVVVTQPPTVFTRSVSLLSLVLASVGGCWIALGNRRPPVVGVPRPYAIAALVLCAAVATRNLVYLLR